MHGESRAIGRIGFRAEKKEMDMDGWKRQIGKYLDILYAGEDRKLAENLLDELYERWAPEKRGEKEELSEKDCMLIAYGDCIWEDGKAPLQSLDEFLREFCGETITNVHLLPVFPYTSDDGFSVQNYKEIDSRLGDWEDIQRLGDGAGVMMDAVVNHSSKSHPWFQECIQGKFPYTQYYIECDPSEDYSGVTRPRALPLLTEIDTVEGKKWFWTTFSDDQMDLNFKSPYLLKEIIELLLFYAKMGARFIRLDAVGFIWKKKGTACMHLEETHTVVKLMCRFLEMFYPGTYIITETNVPHLENISYFGDGDEAHLVYQFPLPPLVLHTMLSQNTEKLAKWADGLKDTPLPARRSFFNFLASHDGIGIRPVDGILDEKEKAALYDAVKKRGGKISYKQNEDGSMSPYELNINYLSAVTDPLETDMQKKAACFLASQAIMLSMQGVPGIYYHSLLGSGNWEDGAEKSGINRRINREKLMRSQLERELSQEGSLRSRVFEGYTKLLNVRKRQKAFSPFARQKILDCGPEIFALERENGQKIRVYINVTDHAARFPEGRHAAGRDLLKDKKMVRLQELEPFEVLWVEQCQEDLWTN